MPRWIALFRGIKVGGKHLLTMKKLVSDLESLYRTIGQIAALAEGYTIRT